MSANFLSLPSELRNKIYEQVLVDQEYVDPFTWYYPRSLTPELLRTNSTVCHEASSLLYAQNRFNFTTYDSELIASFVDQIGRKNAKHIRHIRIDFPDIPNLGRHGVTLGDNSTRILAKIQSDCANLSTLTTSLDSTNAMALKLDALDSPHFVVEALALVDARFRAIPSLEKIVVEIYEDDPSADIRRKMESYGWTIHITEQTEELDFDRSFSDFEDDGNRYDDDCGDDDYDIDNDSDFWRRVGN